MLSKIKRWVRFNLRYLKRPPWDTGVSPPELVRFIESNEPGRALDVGCGTGTNLLTLAEYGWEVVGVDFAWLSILQARKKLSQVGIQATVFQGDVTRNLGLSVSFDLVLDIGCYHSLSKTDRKKYTQNLQKWLHFKGTYLLYAHRRTSPDSEHGIDKDDFQVFKEFLTLIWREDSEENRPDGGGGRPSSWVQFELNDSD